MNTKLSTSPRQLFLALATALLAVFFFTACSDDCDDLRRDVDDLRLRVEKLEDWCNTANSQISALQGLVSALEANDYVTGVTPITEGARETGYIIQFSKSGPITIHHGKDGANGTNGTNGTNGSDGKDGINGLTPLIGAAKDTDGRYYWTVQTGDADPQWLTDAQGNKIPTTGKDGTDGNDGSDGTDAQPPVISVATFEGALYWQVNGQWLLDANNAKVPATGPAGTAGSQGLQGDQGIQGPQGDAVFAPDGVTVDDQAGYVTFTLADKVTTFRLPLYGATVIRFESNEPLWINNKDGARISLIMPRFFPQSDYGGLMAEVVATSDANADIVTRGTSNNWTVKLEPPVFHDNGNIDDPYVEITPPQDPGFVGTKALLRVTLIHANGQESTVSRVLLVTDAIPYDYTLKEQLTDLGIKPSAGQPDQPNSATNPYLIESAQHLQWIKRNPEESYYYKLMKDIQLIGSDSQGNWVPIGKFAGDDETSSSSLLFRGKFDGNGKKVSGIVAPAGYKYFGFFGCCEEAEIQNLTYEGSMDLSRLTDRTIGVGAIVGYLFWGTVTHCSNSANLTCKGTVNAGGIVGNIVGIKQKIAIEACKNTGNIETGGDVGGIAGTFSQSGSSIIGCINTGNIKTTGSAEQYATIAGGIVGSTTGSIKACWSKATSITHQNNGAVGGIAGQTGMTSEIEACTWKAIQGVEGIGKRDSGTTITGNSFQSFTGDRPSVFMFIAMNGTWGKENAYRNYQFNATTDEIEPK